MAEYTGIRAPKFDGKNYEIFKELLTHYLDATKVTDEKQKLAVCLRVWELMVILYTVQLK